MKPKRMACLLLLLSGLLAWQTAWAQSPDELTLKMNRDWGYGGFGQIQGLFTIKATGPADLERVVFLLDGAAMAEVQKPPFSFQFTTDSYPSGQRVLSAVGYTVDGRELRSAETRVEFLSKEQAGKATTKFIVPLVGLLVLFVGGSVGLTLLSTRRKGRVPLGQPRKYGISGGTICPKCGRPFAMSLVGLNMGLSQLTPCPHCRKWVRVRRLPNAVLRDAEAAELQQAEGGGGVAGETEEELMRKALDDSRYQDG